VVEVAGGLGSRDLSAPRLSDRIQVVVVAVEEVA
jgi:hypothetical protein